MVTSFVDESIEDILAGLVSPAPEPEPKAALQVVESFPAPVQLVSSQGVWLSGQRCRRVNHFRAYHGRAHAL
jgi:hypothetical protein